MTNLQGITVAIAPSGIQYFNSMVLNPKLTNTLSQMTPVNQVIKPGSITISPYIMDISMQQPWHGSCDVVVTLSSGHLHSFNPAFGATTQGENGQFTMPLSAQNFSVSFTWNEQYHTDYQWNLPDCSQFVPQDPQNNTFPYTISFSSLAIVIIVSFKYANDSWTLEVVSVVATPQGINPNIPGSSILQYTSSCGNLPDAIKNSVDNIDFAGTITSAVDKQFSSIPATGQITPDISFQFEEGPGGLTFPGNAGILAGVTGAALYKGTLYPGENPPTIPMPPVPAGKHLAYNVSDYTFNSLMWAFFQSGGLTQHVTPGDIPDPGILNTNTYNSTPLQALYDAYPGLDMTADITANTAPTVTFGQIYDLNDAGYAGLKGKMPADIYTKLGNVKNRVSLTEARFKTALVNDIGTDSADLYQAIIEAAAQITAGVVTHNNRVVLNVMKEGNQVPVITFDVSQTDVLQNFALGQSAAAQTLMFAFQLVPELTTTRFISSPISGINPFDYGYIWNMFLQPEFAKKVMAIGNHGVALPRIPNFDFLMSEAVITLNPGYASVVTDVLHTADAGIVNYLASKMLQKNSEVI